MTLSHHDASVEQEYRDSSRLDARIALHKNYSTNPTNWHHWVFDHILALKPQRILEVGCGSGSLWVENWARVPAQWELTLLDQSAGMVEQTRAALAGRSIRFEHGDVRSLPFADASFDLVIANHMLYHVAERDAALVEIRRVLSVEGRLLATTNSAHSMREYDELLETFHNTNDIPHIADVRKPTGFNLEYGAGQLIAHFPQVTVLRYDDSIRVTEPAPIVNYALASSQITPEQSSAFEACVQTHIARTGFFETYKRNGLFVAVK